VRPWDEHYIKVDGIRTHYLEAGSGRPVVLLHAGEFGGAAEFSWEMTIPALAGAYRVIAPDWLGFGHTDKVHDFTSGSARRLAHMASFLDVLEIDSAAFVGNSMGGTLLGKAIAGDPPLLPADAAAIVSGGGFAPDNPARRVLLDYDCTVEGMRKVLEVLFHDERWPQDDDYVARRHAMSVVPGAWECSAASRLRSPVAPRRSEYGVPDTTDWEQVSCPTLFVCGADDVLKEKGFAAKLAERVQRGSVIEYPDCGHAPNIERADQFNADLLEFLATSYPPQPDNAGALVVS
jgi:pimeloyl-ACP methyl ester carboxylesterase